MTETEKKTSETAEAQPATASENFQADINYLFQACESTRLWIVQADNKGGFVLTVNGIIAGFMVGPLSKWLKAWASQSQTQGAITWILLLLFGGYLLTQLYSFINTAMVFIPRPRKVSAQDLHASRHIYNYGLSMHFPTVKDGQKFWDEVKTLNNDDYAREYAHQLHIDSIVCTQKYTAFRKAFWSMMWALGFALLSFTMFTVWGT